MLGAGFTDAEGAKEVSDAIREKGIYVGGVVGTSMLPMLRQGRDRVMIKAPTFPLKKYDVPLYTNGDHITLHRIVHITRGGKYIICGDNRSNYEYGVTDDRIIGVLTAVIRDGRVIDADSEEFYSYARRAVKKNMLPKLRSRLIHRAVTIKHALFGKPNHR